MHASLVLEVRLPGQAEYRAPCRQWVPRYIWWRIRANSVVPVRVDPNDARIVYVHVDDLMQQVFAEQAATKEAGEKRQEALLRGDDRR